MSELKQPTVSVVMITYGHEAFIRQAVEGVLMQECDFPVELIVADDCSLDNTAGVMQEIMATHPRASWIRYTRHPQNKGMMPNFVWALGQAKGKYIALCEGDDYWTDPCKLQRQVDFLEENEEYSSCFHKVKISIDRELVEDFITKIPIWNLSFEELLKGNFIHTPSVIFRNNASRSYSNVLESLKIGDYAIHLLNFKFGKLYFMEEVMGVYRIHDGNSWMHKDYDYKAFETIRLMLSIMDEFDDELKTMLQGAILNNIQSIFYHYQPHLRDLEDFRKSRAHQMTTLIRKFFNRIHV